ncbi:hypothetical protein D3C72_1602740 [compost metagenome]
MRIDQTRYQHPTLAVNQLATFRQRQRLRFHGLDLLPLHHHPHAGQQLIRHAIKDAHIDECQRPARHLGRRGGGVRRDPAVRVGRCDLHGCARRRN